MFNKSHLVGALFALAVVDDIHTRIKSRKVVSTLANAVTEADAVFEAHIAAQNAQIKYLCHIIDKHDLAVDEFDLIVLHYQN
jgi:hypothetical protein